MKFFDKLGLIIFSTIVLILGIILSIIVFGWVDVSIISEPVEYLTQDTAGIVTLCVSIVFILLAIKCIFFNSYSKEELKNKEGILLENDNGKLLVSKDTIENLTNTVVKSFESAETVMTKVEVDEETKIRIYITLFVYPDAIIKDLTNKLQEDVKQTIKRSIDLDVTEVNVRVKNISVKKEPTVKE